MQRCTLPVLSEVLSSLDQEAGPLETVTVEPGLSASGFVAVRPVKGSLTVGDLVEVGVVAATNSNVARTPGSTPSG